MVVWYVGQAARYRLVRYLKVWCVAVVCGTFEYSTVCDLGQCGVEWYGTVWCGAVKCRIMRYGRCRCSVVVCCGTMYDNVVQYCVV